MPKTPLQTYISRDAGKHTVCDPKLITEAWEYRVASQLLEEGDFLLNISVWKLEVAGKEATYICRENLSGEAFIQKSVDLRVQAGMSHKKARAAATEYPTYGGIHSEVNIAAEIYRMPGTVSQVFTERKPCHACQAFMRNNFPAVIHAPFFYYLQPPGTERKWQLKPYKQSLKLYMLNRYQG